MKADTENESKGRCVTFTKIKSAKDVMSDCLNEVKVLRSVNGGHDFKTVHA